MVRGISSRCSLNMRSRKVLCKRNKGLSERYGMPERYIMKISCDTYLAFTQKVKGGVYYATGHELDSLFNIR